MTMGAHDPKQIEAILKITQHEQEKLKKHIYQVNDTIDKKEFSINRFKEYVKTYAVNTESPIALNVQILKNSLAFQEHLLHVIQLEEKDLIKLQNVKHNLLESYNQCANKAEGLTGLYEKIMQAKAVAQEKREENERFDVSVIRKKLIWNP